MMEIGLAMRGVRVARGTSVRAKLRAMETTMDVPEGAAEETRASAILWDCEDMTKAR